VQVLAHRLLPDQDAGPVQMLLLRTSATSRGTPALSETGRYGANSSSERQDPTVTPARVFLFAGIWRA
jgi:hypothetical protein